MRTSREAKIPSSRMGYFVQQPDRHYVLAQRQGPDWEFDTVSDLLYTYDPLTGQPAYRLEVDGSEADGARYTGKRNAVLLSCSKEYADRIQRQNVFKSKQMKDADFTLGQFSGGQEYRPDAMPEVETTVGEALETMHKAIGLRRVDAEQFGSPELDNR